MLSKKYFRINTILWLLININKHKKNILCENKIKNNSIIDFDRKIINNILKIKINVITYRTN